MPPDIRLPYKIWYRYKKGEGPCPVSEILWLTDYEQDSITDYMDDPWELRLVPM